MSGISEQDRGTIAEVIERLKDKPGALLPILHGIQDELRYIPPESIPSIAEALNSTKADVQGVISFYHHFRTTKPGNHQLEICRAEACQARGARDLEAHAKQKLGVDYHQTTMDREFSLEPVYCLGNCACGPSVRVGDEIVGRVDAERFDELVDELTTVAVEIH